MKFQFILLMEEMNSEQSWSTLVVAKSLQRVETSKFRDFPHCHATPTHNGISIKP